MSPGPKVSVVLLCHDQEAFVRQAVESVLTQTHGNLELMAVDNGSTDATPRILREYAADPRVKPRLHPDNAAVTKRQNAAIAESTGDFVSLLYADDFYLPRKLEVQLACFAGLAPDYGVVHGPGLRRNLVSGQQWVERALPESGWIFPAMLRDFYRSGFVNPIAPLFRRECLVHNPFHEDIFMEGESIYFRLALRYRFQYLEEPLVVMQEHLGNASKAIKSNRECVLAVFDRLARDPALPPDQRTPLLALEAAILVHYGWQGMRVAQDPAWARDCFRRAVGLRWPAALHPRTVGGLALSVLPEAVVRLINRAANRLSTQKDNIAFKPGYGS